MEISSRLRLIVFIIAGTLMAIILCFAQKRGTAQAQANHQDHVPSQTPCRYLRFTASSDSNKVTEITCVTDIGPISLSWFDQSQRKFKSDKFLISEKNGSTNDLITVLMSDALITRVQFDQDAGSPVIDLTFQFGSATVASEPGFKKVITLEGTHP
jgi:hypothetical protein